MYQRPCDLDGNVIPIKEETQWLVFVILISTVAYFDLYSCLSMSSSGGIQGLDLIIIVINDLCLGIPNLLLLSYLATNQLTLYRYPLMA